MLPEYGIIRRTFWLLADCFVRSKENMNAYKGCFIGCLGMIVATGVMLVGVAALVWLGVAAADMKLDDGGGKWSERDKPRDKVWGGRHGDVPRREREGFEHRRQDGALTAAMHLGHLNVSPRTFWCFT